MPYKILSLDGGASWAMVQARVLQDLYSDHGDIKGHALLRKFDLVIANSGGSVLLGLLCNNMSIQKIIGFYNNAAKLKKVYPPLFPGERLLQQIIRLLGTGAGAKYSASRKMKNLRSILEENDDTPGGVPHSVPVNTYLNILPLVIGKNYREKDVQLVIPAFDYFRKRVSFFRSNVNTFSFSNKFYQITLGEAIHASCNAPINYYDRPAQVEFNLLQGNDCYHSWFWDGAVAGFNNPVLAGLVEAITSSPETELDSFYILSLGTGLSGKAVIVEDKTSTDPERQQRFKLNYGKPFVDWKKRFSFFQDIQKMSVSILSDPPDSASFIAYSIINRSFKEGHDNLVRINPLITPELTENRYDYPPVYNTSQKDKKDFLDLMELDFDIYEEDDLKLVKEMCDRFIVNNKTRPFLRNQLIRGEPGGKFIGFSSYRDAKSRWKELDNSG